MPYKDPNTGEWMTDEGIPISQAGDGQLGSYLPGYLPQGPTGDVYSSWPQYQAGMPPPVQPASLAPETAAPDAAPAAPARNPYLPGSTDYPIAGGQKFFDYPDWTPPEENFSTFDPKAMGVDYLYPEFQGPTAENFKADPGYEFRLGEMQRALKNDRSAKGLMVTGGTLHDLAEMTGGMASQEFGNVWNRDYTKYNANRANAGDNFTRALTTYLTGETGKEKDWERSRDAYTTNLGKTATGYGLNLDTSKLNLAKDSSQFGNLLNLYTLATAGMPTYQATA